MLSGLMLMELFETIRDPRLERKREHKLVDILVITFCAVFSGCRSWNQIEEFGEAREEFFRTFLELPSGIPSHDTFNRVFQLLDFNIINKLLFEWLSEFRKSEGKELLHLDGKFINGSNKEAGNSRSSLGMVSAYASETGICLMSVMTRLKKDEGEKKAMEKLIDGLNLKKSVVTIDAGGATPTIVDKIVEKKGEYLIAVKENQKSLLKLCEKHFEMNGKTAAMFETKEKRHGRQEQRIYEQLSIHENIPEGVLKSAKKQVLKWPQIKSLIKVSSSRVVGNNIPETSVRYYMSSLAGDVREIGTAIRSHWKIENNLHWTLDVHFMEDHCRTRTGYADANLALLRRLAISIIKLNNPKKKTTVAMMLRCAVRDDEMLKMLRSSAF